MITPHLLVIGGVNIDLLVGPQAPWPTPGTEVILDHSDLRVGGGGGNTALALEALSVPSVLVGGYGNDAFGPWLREKFTGVLCDWHQSASPTGLCVGITHPDGDRTFFTHMGHLGDDPPERVYRALDRAGPGSTALFTAGFLMALWLPEYDQLLSYARARGVRVALDTGWPPPGWTPEVRAMVRSWLGKTDLLLINELEATALAETDDVYAAGMVLLEQLAQDATLIIKRGPWGAAAWVGSQQVEVSAPQVQVVDTIGAGDTFNAAFLAAQYDGRSLQNSMAAAVAYASHSISTQPRTYAATLGDPLQDRPTELSRP
ncbi:carbohydrate kinase family protein [Deinococcus deserti]|uniref:Putative ribokinase n=1 Tax=Deinococcus deserti (strain DSM 17065 / CIP 109153 / LMG 22923 / VCD115) TaxID=546414 RepID=C1D3Q2_DEIDV|nr:carbohydrate kinase family protein [Deinococcus deserti]ACO48131.1 putative ribokinase [Deinococcus deserti VCD115]